MNDFLDKGLIAVNDSGLCDAASITVCPAHFTQTDQDRFLPTSHAQSHWGDDHLNGPALVGLAAHPDARYGDALLADLYATWRELYPATKEQVHRLAATEPG